MADRPIKLGLRGYKFVLPSKSAFGRCALDTVTGMSQNDPSVVLTVNSHGALMVRFVHLGHFLDPHTVGATIILDYLKFMKYVCLIYCGVPRFVKHIISRL